MGNQWNLRWGQLGKVLYISNAVPKKKKKRHSGTGTTLTGTGTAERNGPN